MTHAIFVQDVTLRDGMHAVRHRIDRRGRRARSSPRSTTAGVDAIEVAHGDGLAGGQPQLRSRQPHRLGVDRGRRRELSRARLTTLLLPGVGTIHDLKRAHALGVRSVRVATHCTEADVSAQHIAAARELGMDVSGFLMMSHMADRRKLAGQAKLMESYGAHCVYVTDSGGRLTMDGVRERVRAYRDVLDPATELGIHAHENLSLAVANSVVAVEEGVTRVDASLAGHGAGAGNCPIEPFVAVANLHGLGARLRPVRAAGRRRRPRPTAAGPARAGRPRDPHARLRRRLLQLPAPRRDRVAALRRGRPAILAGGRPARDGRRPGGHDHRHRPRPEPSGLREGAGLGQGCLRRLPGMRAISHDEIVIIEIFFNPGGATTRVSPPPVVIRDREEIFR